MWCLETTSRGDDDTLGEPRYYTSSEELGIKEISRKAEAEIIALKLLDERKGSGVINPNLVWKTPLIGKKN